MEANRQDFVVAYCRWDDYILVVHKDRPDWMKKRINLPGGKIDPDDANPVAAAVRELKEESGYEPSTILVCPAYEVGLIEGKGFKIHAVEVLGPRREDPVVPRPGETELVRWEHYYSLLQNPMLMPNLRVIIPLLMTGVHDWVIHDDGSSWGNADHAITVQVPTHLKVASALD